MENKLSTLIPLEGTNNTRDLGGLTNNKNKRIKNGRLYRSDFLHNLTTNDKNKLSSKPHNLKYSIDLRGDKEQARTPDPIINGCINISVPLQNDHNKSIVPYPYQHYSCADEYPDLEYTIRFLHLYSKDGNCNTTMMKNYRNNILDEFCLKSWKKFFEILRDNKDGSIIFHCHDGKDRTGVAAYLILTLLEIPKDIIINDYLLSEKYIQPKIEKRKNEAFSLKEENPYLYEQVVGVASINLSWINAADKALLEVGGIHNWLINYVGLTENDIIEIQDNYLE